jgi:glycosyltransferase involved in cell wall biosynthesis
MRIVIDMQGAQSESRFRGIGRYTIGFALSVVKSRSDHEVLLVLNGLLPEDIEHIRSVFDGFLPQENILVWTAPGPVCASEPDNEDNRNVAELIREAFILSLKPDVIHITSLFEGYQDEAVLSIGRFDKRTPVTVTFYDLIPMLNPEQYLKTNSRYEAFYNNKVEILKNASALIAISESSRQEAISGLGVSEKVVFNGQLGHEKHFKKIKIAENGVKSLQEKFNLKLPFVLYFGGSDERKNVPRLIDAFSKVSSDVRSGLQLVIAGGLDPIHKKEFLNVASRLNLKTKEICFTGRISDEELVALYNLCLLFVFPSFHEGFGLPILEAMACGAPVICSNVTSMPEVVGLSEATFDPFDTSDITLKLTKALSDREFLERLRENSNSQIGRYSWEDTANRAIGIWEAICKESENRSPESVDHSANRYQLLEAILPYLNAQDSNNLKQISRCIARNEGANSTPQLLVDCSELVNRDAKTGIQRVVRSVLSYWLSCPPDGWEVRPVYATTEGYGYRYANRFAAEFMGLDENYEIDEPVEAYRGDVFIGLDLNPHVVNLQMNVFKEWYLRGVCVQFVIYDLLPIKYPEYFPSGAKSTHEKWLYNVAQFSGVVCISKSVADDVRSWIEAYGPDRSRPLSNKWFHLGADTDTSKPTVGMPEGAISVLKLIQERPSFLSVGTIEARKGHAQTLSAFELLWKEDIDVNLVLVGKEGWRVEELLQRLRNHKELGKRLFWLDEISDEYLDKIYEASRCLIAASEGEGFGLPLIEAAQHKLPLIVRDIPVFREVAGDHACYFDSIEPSGLGMAIKQWLDMYNRGIHPVSNNMPWLTWKQSSDELKSLICNL